MEPLTQVQTGIDREDSRIIRDRSFIYLRFAFWFVAGLTGFLQIWLTDRVIWADSLSYLDSGDMLWQGDFANAITNHWSPGFPFLLGLAIKILHPVGLWEVAVAKLVDLIIFLFTVGSFDWFVVQFCRFHEIAIIPENRESSSVVPKVAMAAAGYLLFLWTIVWLLPAWFTTPDMLVMGILFLAFGLLLKIRLSATGFQPFSLLGLVLGCGYLVKAPMFPLGIVFLGVAFVLVGNWKKAVPRVALSLTLFALIAAPLVVKLSELAGGLTFGKSGAWNYARYVNGIAVAYHWHGQPPGSGTPLHPTRVIFEAPTVYEFGSPVRGTFPPWRDPYYWFAGITPHFDARGQWRVIKANARILEFLASGLDRGFVYAFLILLFMSSRKHFIVRVISRQWFLLLPCLAAIAMFSIVLVQDRYIAPYPIVIGLVVFSGVSIVNSTESIKLVNVTVLLAGTLFAVSSAKPAAGALLSFARSLRTNDILSRGSPWHMSSEALCEALWERGIKKGDRVAYIGGLGDFYWARLAGVQVNAEIRQLSVDGPLQALVPPGRAAEFERSVDLYWASPSETKEKIDSILYKTGSRAVVTDAFPTAGGVSGWDHVSGTSYFIHILEDHNEASGK